MTDNSAHFEQHSATNHDIARGLQEILADDRSWLFATIDHVGLSLVAHCLAGMSREAVMRTASFRIKGAAFTAIQKADLSIDRLNAVMGDLGLTPRHHGADAERDVIAVCDGENVHAMHLVMTMLRAISPEGVAERHGN